MEGTAAVNTVENVHFQTKLISSAYHFGIRKAFWSSQHSMLSWVLSNSREENSGGPVNKLNPFWEVRLWLSW